MPTLLPKAMMLALNVIAVLNCGCHDRTLPEPVPQDAGKRFARAVCEAQFECGCGFYATPSDCEADVAETFDALLDMGATMNEECFEEFLASEVYSSCDMGSGIALPSCVTLVGSADLGEPCLPSTMFGMVPGQMCKAGLSCSVTGVCQDVDHPAPLNAEPCNLEFLGSCGGQYCDDETKLCEDRKAIGESCTEVEECEFDSYCQGLGTGSGMCTPDIELGQPCSPDDWMSCHEGWCDATSHVCVEVFPYICASYRPAG